MLVSSEDVDYKYMPTIHAGVLQRGLQLCLLASQQLMANGLTSRLSCCSLGMQQGRLMLVKVNSGLVGIGVEKVPVDCKHCLQEEDHVIWTIPTGTTIHKTYKKQKSRNSSSILKLYTEMGTNVSCT